MVGSPTGRLEETDIFKLWRQFNFHERPPTYLREAMGVLSESVENGYVALDFSKLEDRVVAVMCSMGPDGKLEYKPILDRDMYAGRTVTSVILDDLEPTTSDGSDIHECMLKLLENGPFNHGDAFNREYKFIDEASMMPLPLPIKPMKQNGRSASYLDLDPTKNTRKRRRR